LVLKAATWFLDIPVIKESKLKSRQDTQMFRIIPEKIALSDTRQENQRYLIELNKVVKAYKTEAGDFLALKNVTLSIGSGEFVGVIGKSGSGKSTLINMITGIDRPTKGDVYVANTPIHNLNEGRMAQWRGHNLGIVFQFFQLLPILTVIENVMLPMDFCHLYSSRQRKEKALQALDMVGVAEQANKLPSQLSGGEQQRVAIARALANDPPIIMADEPTGNLDSKTSAIVFEVFEKLVSSGKTIVMVTHDGDLARKVKRTIIIADGEIIEEYLSRTFPALTQSQLIWTTSSLKPLRFPAGFSIINQYEPADKFYFVTKGEVNVTVHSPRGKEYQVARLHRGEYFGGIGLIRGCPNMTTVHAGGTGEIEVASLDKEHFNQLISQSPLTKEAIQKTADERFNSILNIIEEQEHVDPSLA
jgi:putative ABC transport system ATP-binding protein